MQQDTDLAETFARDGFAVLSGYYDVSTDIAPIAEGVRQIVELVARKHGVKADCSTPEAAMRQGIMALRDADRSHVGEVYDAVKQIPAFMRLVSHERNAELFGMLRPGSEPGLAAGGYGIRIDLPAEDRFRANWHQEFPAQLRSPDGIVFWSPLLPVTEDLGPVEICPGSHREGVVPVQSDDGGVGKSGAYALKLKGEEELLRRYEKIAPLSRPGDLVVMDFLTLHQSGLNRADHPRWSMQFRYFNFNNPVGIRIGWKGSFASGVDFAKVLPELQA